MSTLQSSGWLSATIAILLLLPVIYLLSIGPVVYLFERNVIPHDDATGEVLEAIYMPVEWLVDKSPAFERGMAIYLSLWSTPEEGH